MAVPPRDRPGMPNNPPRPRRAPLRTCTVPSATRDPPTQECQTTLRRRRAPLLVCARCPLRRAVKPPRNANSPSARNTLSPSPAQSALCNARRPHLGMPNHHLQRSTTALAHPGDPRRRSPKAPRHVKVPSSRLDATTLARKDRSSTRDVGSLRCQGAIVDAPDGASTC